MGYVQIGSFLVPESSKPVGKFACLLCSQRFETPDRMERHAAQCVKKNGEAAAENHPHRRLPEFYGQHDVEREAWLKTPAGRAEWYARMGWTDPAKR